MLRLVISTLLFLQVFTQGQTTIAQHGDSSAPVTHLLPHVDDCNFCTECMVDEPPVSLPPSGTEGDKAFKPLGQSNRHLLGPYHEEAKKAKPNCTACRGCNVQLVAMQKKKVSFGNISYRHVQGTKTAWQFFATTPGSATRYIIKVYCIPIHKETGWNTTAWDVHCHRSDINRRHEVMLANMRLSDECGLKEMTPRVWLGKVSAIIPEFGYHIHWYGLWMEEARGIPLRKIYGFSSDRVIRSESDKMAMVLLGQKLNSTQVLLGSVMDLLMAQCDRHGLNIFIDDRGQMQYIDNENVLRVARSSCGYDNVHLPGSRWHSYSRIGTGPVPNYYRRKAQEKGFCTGPIDMFAVLDYRCHVPGNVPGKPGMLGTSFPEPLTRCMRRLSSLTVSEIMQQYSFSRLQYAEVLKNRSTDMLMHGFEWTMQHGLPINSDIYKIPQQPACCSLTLGHDDMLTCNSTCWRPVLPEHVGNSTDLKVISPLS